MIFFLIVAIRACTNDSLALTEDSQNKTGATLETIDKKAVPQNNTATNNQNSSQNTQAAECLISKKFPQKVYQWCGLISFYARDRDLPPDLIAGLILQESGGNPKAISSSGAVGLMQVMPSDGLAKSFMCVNGPCFQDRPPTKKLLDPEFNIKYGSKMLMRLVRREGDLRNALKSYGPMDVGYYYADKVLAIAKTYSN